MSNLRRILCYAVAAATAGAGTPAQDGDDLQAAAQNPVAAVISVPFQHNAFFGIGPGNDDVHVMNVQPVVPVRVSEGWNLITRTIVPIIYVPGTVEGLDVLPQGVGSGTEFGLGDINVTGFFSPRAPSKTIWGIGPTVNLPTATDDLLGTEKWSAGVSGVLLVQPQPWTLGVLARQLWSFAGDDLRQDVDQTLVQPFVNYNLQGGWYLVSAPVVTANWEARSGQRWVIPVGGGVGRLFRAGSLPLNVSGHVYGNVEHPDLGPDWSLRLQVQLLFPK